MPAVISVIIPCYNQAHYIVEAVQSALAQDYGYKEVIVVDDGSTDDSSAVLATAFGDRIVCLRQPNRGLSAARNAGYRVAHGDYVLFLDGDDILLPGCLRITADYLDQHPDVGLVCGDAVLFDETGPLPDKPGPRPRDGQDFRYDTIYFCPQVGTVLMRKACLEKVGLFDEEMKGGAEDWLVWVKTARYYRMIHLAHPFVRYRQHALNATRNLDRINSGNRRAVAQIVQWSEFDGYPARFQARLLLYRCAAAWRTEPRRVALGYLWRAMSTAPGEWRFGLEVFRQALQNRKRRRRECAGKGDTE